MSEPKPAKKDEIEAAVERIVNTYVNQSRSQCNRLIRTELLAAEQRGAAAAGALAHAKETRDDKAGSTHVPASCLHAARLRDAAKRARVLLEHTYSFSPGCSKCNDLIDFLRSLAGEK